MRILWIGWGDLGQAATPALVEAGHEVVAVRRHPPDRLPDGVAPLTADLHRPEEVRLPPDVTACVVTLTPDTRDRGGYERTYVQGMANLHALVEGQVEARDPPLDRLIFVSSTAVYGQSDGEWVEETTSTSPTGFNGQVMLRAERLALSARWPTTVARLSGIYGPGRKRLLERVRAGRPSRNAWTNRIHRDDAAAALVHLLSHPDPPRIVNVTDTRPATNDEVVTWLAERMGVDTPPIEGGPRTGKRVDGRLLRDLGFSPDHPTFREGYSQVLETS